MLKLYKSATPNIQNSNSSSNNVIKTPQSVNKSIELSNDDMKNKIRQENQSNGSWNNNITRMNDVGSSIGYSNHRHMQRTITTTRNINHNNNRNNSNNVKFEPYSMNGRGNRNNYNNLNENKSKKNKFLKYSLFDEPGTNNSNKKDSSSNNYYNQDIVIKNKNEKENGNNEIKSNEMTFVIAMHSFEATNDIGNNNNNTSDNSLSKTKQMNILSFSQNDRLLVIEKSSSLWWYGEHCQTRKKGMFPTNYVKFENSNNNENESKEQSVYDQVYNNNNKLSTKLRNINFKLNHSLLKDNYCRLGEYKDIFSKNDIFNNKRILIFGCQSGILSIFGALHTNCKHIYSIDHTGFTQHSQTVWNQNCKNVDNNKITFISGKVEEISLQVLKQQFNLETHSIDIILSEWMGDLLFIGSMLNSLIFAKKNLLTTSKQGLILPSKVKLIACPVSASDYRRKYIGFWDDIQDINMSCLKECARKELFSSPIKADTLIESNDLLSDNVITIADLNMYNIDSINDNNLQCMKQDFECMIKQTDTLDGFVVWFDTLFENSNGNCFSKLTTSPNNESTHWKQILFLFDQSLVVNKNQIINGCFKMTQIKNNSNNGNNNVHFQIDIVCQVDSVRLHKKWTI